MLKNIKNSKTQESRDCFLHLYNNSYLLVTEQKQQNINYIVKNSF